VTGARPFVPRLVVQAPREALAELTTWGRQWSEAGADGLALEGAPADPAVLGLVAGLRAASALPLEVIPPPGTRLGPDTAEALARAGADWVLPAQAPEGATAAALEAAGVGWAWPLEAGTPPAACRRVHAAGGAGPGDWPAGPATAERSLVPPPGAVVGFGQSGADTLILPGAELAGADPAAALAEWRR